VSGGIRGATGAAVPAKKPWNWKLCVPVGPLAVPERLWKVARLLPRKPEPAAV